MPVTNDGSDLIEHHYKRLVEIQVGLHDSLGIPPPDGVLVFRCQTCETIKALGEFERAKRRYFGLRPECKACRNARRRRYPPLEEGRLTCRTCNREKEAGNFSLDSRSKTGRSSECSDCVTQRVKTWTTKRSGKITPEVARLRRERTERLVIEERLSKTPTVDLKRCGYCKAVKDVSQFYNRVDTRDCLSDRCSVCDSLKRQRYRDRQANR